MCVCVLRHFCHASIFLTLWTVALQAPLFMGFSRQEYWSRLPFPSPCNLPDPGTEPMPFALQTVSLPLSHQGSPFYTQQCIYAYPNLPINPTLPFPHIMCEKFSSS